MTDALDHLVVLHSVNRKHAGKRFWLDKKTGKIKSSSYGHETHFRVEEAVVSDIKSLARALERVSRNPFAFVVRGQLLPGFDPKKTLRRCIPNKKTGEPATFEAVARRWQLIDVDKIARPALIDPKADPEGAIEYVIGLLPPECWDGWYWWQWSSSQSVDPKVETLSLHLWLWLEEPLDDAALKRWAISANMAVGYKLIDPAPYSSVQAHYLAIPDFVAPLSDPLLRRCGLRRGLDEAVRLVIPEPASIKHPDQLSAASYTPGHGVEAYLAMIGGPEGTREPIRSAIASYIAINGSDADCTDLKAAIRAAILANRPGVDLGHYEDDDHLDRLIDWVKSVHGDRPPMGWRAGPPPDLIDEGIPIEPLDGRAKPNGHDPDRDTTDDTAKAKPGNGAAPDATAAPSHSAGDTQSQPAALNPPDEDIPEPGAGGGGEPPEPPAPDDSPNGYDPDGATEEGDDEFVGVLPAEFSHEQLALQFTAEHQADWRYVALWGKWQQWTATRWRNEDTLRAFELVRRVCRAASSRVFKPASLARSGASATTVAGVEKLARADRRHAMLFDQYDAKDWDFNQPPRKE
jgi:hypothetical protein